MRVNSYNFHAQFHLVLRSQLNRCAFSRLERNFLSRFRRRQYLNKFSMNNADARMFAFDQELEARTAVILRKNTRASAANPVNSQFLKAMMGKASGMLQDLATSPDLPESKDSSVRQAIEDVLARVNLTHSTELDVSEQEAHRDQGDAQQVSTSVYRLGLLMQLFVEATVQL